jgi:uncharacterized protein
MNNALLIFMKNLIYGQVKTRLAATVGNESAVKIYQQLLKHCHAVFKNISADKIVFYSDFIEEDIWKNDEFEKEIQQGNDLGERMRNAFILAFEKTYEKVIIVGTDCPQIDENILKNAFTKLDDHDIIIGPSTDGGYYLLGMKKAEPFLFENIKWSTGSVLKETISHCNKNNWSYFLLPELTDIDEEKDLVHFKETFNFKPDF